MYLCDINLVNMKDLFYMIIVCIPAFLAVACMRAMGKNDKEDDKPPFSGDIVIKIEHVSENSDEQSPCPQSHSAPAPEPSSPTGKEESSKDWACYYNIHIN